MQPLDLQSDTYLQSDMLLTALRCPGSPSVHVLIRIFCGLNARKPDFVACEQHKHSASHSLINAFIILFPERLISKLAICKLSILLVAVAGQAA